MGCKAIKGLHHEFFFSFSFFKGDVQLLRISEDCHHSMSKDKGCPRPFCDRVSLGGGGLLKFVYVVRVLGFLNFITSFSTTVVTVYPKLSLRFIKDALTEKRVPKQCPWGAIATNSTLFSEGCFFP